MNPKVILIIQLALMGLFFYLIFGFFDAKQTSGLIGIGASMVIIFGIVLFLEKIKEKMEQPINTETPIEQPPATTPSATPSPVNPASAQPSAPSTQTNPAQTTQQPKI